MISGKRRLIALSAVVAVTVSSCTGGPHSKRSPASLAAPAGGTLRVGILMQRPDGQSLPCEFTFCGGQHDDPQWAGEDPMTYEILRCCLARTLLSYNGQPTNRGGTALHPDLATQLPAISNDGLTWTFHLKRGLHYAPPLQHVEITTADLVRSIERLLGPPPPDGPDYYDGVLDPYIGNCLAVADLIEGAREYVDGKAEHITGLGAPDRYTFRIHLTRPDGALASLLSEPDTAPIPPSSFDASVRFGVLDGHTRPAFGYIVASGPYIIEGGGKVDFSKSPDEQLPATGDAPDSLTLARNPSWPPSTDPLRAAQPDRIVLTPVANADDALSLVKAGALDLVFNWDPTPDQLSAEAVGGGTRTFTSTRDWVAYLDLNTAIRPFDDVHVRRAINYALARDPVASAFESTGLGAVPATHIGLDSEEDNLLLNYDPYRSASGDPQAAKREMAQSRYDRNHDGLCDAPACDGIRMLVDRDMPGDRQAALIVAGQAATVGIKIRVEAQDRQMFNSSYGDPQARVPIRLDNWIKDLSSGSTYFPQLFGSPATGIVGFYSPPLLGAPASQLRKWGYTVTSVPNVDGQIESCLPLGFGAQVRCWAQLDQYLMTQVVPWVPLVNLTAGRLLSSRVASFTFDQSPPTPLPSLDRIVIRPGVAPSPSPVPSFPVPLIPEGVYRFTITKADLYGFDPRFDPNGVDENTGMFTVYVRRGTFEWVESADHPIYSPFATGTYRGSGQEVTFEVQAPAGNAITLPTERWSFVGNALHFHLVSCGNLQQVDPHNPYVCGDFRATFEAHPWVKVG